MIRYHLTLLPYARALIALVFFTATHHGNMCCSDTATKHPNLTSAAEAQDVENLVNAAIAQFMHKKELEMQALKESIHDAQETRYSARRLGLSIAARSAVRTENACREKLELLENQLYSWSDVYACFDPSKPDENQLPTELEALRTKPLALLKTMGSFGQAMLHELAETLFIPRPLWQPAGISPEEAGALMKVAFAHPTVDAAMPSPTQPATPLLSGDTSAYKAAGYIVLRLKGGGGR